MMFYVDGRVDEGEFLSPRNRESMRVTDQSMYQNGTPNETPRQTSQGDGAYPSRRPSATM